LLAHALLEYETPDEEDAYAAAGVTHVLTEEDPTREAAVAPGL
jgi:hypothetical protein